MSWQDRLNGDSLAWLLEEGDPGVRYLALRDLVGASPQDADLIAARKAAHRQGPIATILDHMQPEGFWEKPGLGYGPKYKSTVWSMITLGQLGASAAEDERIARACAYLLGHVLAWNSLDCLHGNLCAALLDLGCDDPRLEESITRAARGVTGEGVAPATDRKAEVRYHASGNCGPGFACAYVYGEPCAWGAIKIALAFARWPAERRTPLIERAIRETAEFLLNTDPATAAYPVGKGRISEQWWKFGFPIFYTSDVLQTVEALVGLGYGRDSRLANALDLVLSKQDAQGRWKLEHKYYNKVWVDFGRGGQPNKWITLRVLRALKAVG
jgi:hypothetical protein